jgi:tetratricopeptide (TPR) repeat protein
MPPWLPEAGHGDFVDERRLTDAQIKLIQDWARRGAPEGARTEAPSPPAFPSEWALGTPDLVIQVSEPFALPAEGPDVFWNFILPRSIATTRLVKGVEIRPGNSRVVHHANLLVDHGRSARTQEKTPGSGFPGMDLNIETDTFDPDSHFLFWKPGGIPRFEPEGMAWRLEPRSDLVLNVHMKPSGRPELVQPAVGLYFTSQSPGKTPMLVKIENDRALDIPAGVRDFQIAEDFRLPVDVDVLAVYPHAHYLGTLLEGYATLPDGSRRWLIRVPHWDVNWQSVYRYRAPVFLPKGTTVSMRFHYDNSEGNLRNPNRPPRRVTNGNQATDEMGHLWLQILPRGDGDRRSLIQEALLRRRLEKYRDDAGAHLSLGALLLDRHEDPAAIDQLREGLRLEPDHAQGWNNLGAAFVGQGKSGDAIEQFRRALGLQHDYPAARYNLANALAAEGRIEEAAAAFRVVLAASPEDRAAREQLRATLIRIGDAAASAGRFADAAQSYRELASLDPGNADIRNNYGIILARTGDLSGAVEQFEAALKVNPGHAAARRNLEQVRERLTKHQ